MPLQSHLFAGDPKLEAAAVSDPAHILPGAVGPHVAKIQRALIELDEAAIDRAELQNAQYGPSTAKAVLQYKRKRNIVNHSYQASADDIVGRMTMAALDKEMLHHRHDRLEIEIEGPCALFPHRVASEKLPHLILASLVPVADARPSRPRPGRLVVGTAITSAPAMPGLSFRVVVPGVDPEVIARTAFEWVLTISFDASHCRNGPARQINETIRKTVIGDLFVPVFPNIRGGVPSATVTATIDGRRRRANLTHGRIIGTNPTREELFAGLPNKTLRRMTLQESGGRQFDVAQGGVSPCPLWSGDKLGGVGLFQITLPHPTADEVWNWRSNVAGGSTFSNKRSPRRGGIRRACAVRPASETWCVSSTPIATPPGSEGRSISNCPSSQLEISTTICSNSNSTPSAGSTDSRAATASGTNCMSSASRWTGMGGCASIPSMRPPRPAAQYGSACRRPIVRKGLAIPITCAMCWVRFCERDERRPQSFVLGRRRSIATNNAATTHPATMPTVRDPSAA